jgi:hypothetical protein
METSLATQSQNTLIRSLQFSLPGNAGYILSRTNGTLFPQGGNQYSPTGVRQIRFNISDATQFLDPHSMRLMFTLTNTHGTHPLQLCGPPFVLFQRARLLCNGVVIEDHNYSHRQRMMMYHLQPQRRNSSNLLEWTWQDEHPAGMGATGDDAAAREAEAARYSQIAGAASKRFLMDLPFGLFKQSTYIPLKACPLTLELELIQTAAEGLWDTVGTTTRSTDFALSDVQLKLDTVQLRPDMHEQINQHLLSGQPMPIHFTGLATQMVALTGARTFTVNVNRAFSRLKSVYFNFYLPPAGPLSEAQRSQYGLSNYFYYPAPGTGAVPPSAPLTVALDTLKWQLQIGAKTWPVRPVEGVNETAYRLRCALDEALYEEFDISIREYLSTKFIAAIDLEKAAIGPGAGASYSGVNTKGGEQLTFEIRDFPRQGDPAAGALPTQMYITCEYDCILNIRAEGCEMLD